MIRPTLTSTEKEQIKGAIAIIRHLRVLYSMYCSRKFYFALLAAEKELREVEK